MAVLSKVRASTLMETMVATVLIVIIFMVASLIMNSLMAAQVNSNTSPVKERIKKLEYSYMNSQLKLPYQESWNEWEIIMATETHQKIPLVRIEATHTQSKRIVESTIFGHER